MNLAENIAQKSSMTIKTGKEAFYKQFEMNLSDAYEYTSRVMAENTLKDDAKEGIESFLKKRDPNWSDS
jgi:enoyl-CoA hydratase/carnithine racemase